jgi:hypothetical protein
MQNALQDLVTPKIGGQTVVRIVSGARSEL